MEDKYNVCGFDKETELNNLHSDNYVNKIGVCPKCHSEYLEYRKNPCFNGDNISFEYYCKDCGTEGEECYYMDFVGHTFYDNDKEEQIELWV